MGINEILKLAEPVIDIRLVQTIYLSTADIMGCVQSTEGQVLSKEPGQAESGPSGGVQLMSTDDIPQIPGWDGVAMATMPVKVSFEMKGGWGSVTASMEPLFNAIMAQNTAGDGYTLTAVFLPVTTQGKQRGQPMEQEPTGLTTVTARAMCIFQKDLHIPTAPQETLLLNAPMKIKTKPFSMDPTYLQVEGYEGLYGQLVQAGELINFIVVI